MEILVFAGYLLFFLWIVTTFPFFKNSGLSRWQLALLFCIKVAAGIAYALFYKLPKYFPGADTWRFYRLSLNETSWLKRDPTAFFADLFIYGYDKSGGLFSGENSYWNDLKSNVLIKLMAVINVLTNSSYYTAIIFFNFLFFIGLIALFKFYKQLFPKRKFVIIAGIFLLPSTLFWCSGIHKDGLLLSAIGIISYSVHQLIYQRPKFLQIVSIVVAFALIFMLRNYLLFALLPALFCWWLSVKFSRTTVYTIYNFIPSRLSTFL